MKAEPQCVVLIVLVALGTPVNRGRAQNSQPVPTDQAPSGSKIIFRKNGVNDLNWMATGFSVTVSPVSRKEGRLLSQPFALKPLGHFRLSLRLRRSPGIQVRFTLLEESVKGELTRHALTLELPRGPRPNWWPIAPFDQDYVTWFGTRPDARKGTLEVKVSPGKEVPPGNLVIHETRLARAGSFALGQVGQNSFSLGEMEGTPGHALPWGWQYWGKVPQGATSVSTEHPWQGPTCLAVQSPRRHFLMAAQPFPLEYPALYQVEFHARGKGDITLGIHPLTQEFRPGRVGDPQPFHVRCESPGWVRFHRLWFSCVPFGARAQLYLGLGGNLCLDSIQFRLLQKEAK